jgi:hypothetical protein
VAWIDEIRAASDVMDDVEVLWWVERIRSLPAYIEGPLAFPDPLARLRELQVSVDALDVIRRQMLNALRARADIQGFGEESKAGGFSGIRWARADNRNALIRAGLSVMYDVPAEGSSVGPYVWAARMIDPTCNLW